MCYVSDLRTTVWRQNNFVLLSFDRNTSEWNGFNSRAISRNLVSCRNITWQRSSTHVRPKTVLCNRKIRCLLTYVLITHSLTPWSRFFLEKLTDFKLVKKLPAFYGTQKFITAFTSARQLSLSWDSSINFITPDPTSWRSILILSCHLRLDLPSGLFPSGFPTKTLYMPLLYPIRATCLVYLILIDFITQKILGEQ